MVMIKTVLLKIPSRLTHRRSGKYNIFQGSQVRCFDFDQIRLWRDTMLYDEIKIMKTLKYGYSM